MHNDLKMGFIPYALQNVFDGVQTPSAVKNNSYAYAFWCRALYQRLCSRIEFDLPEDWNRAKDFFEACLFARGFVAVFDTKEYGITFQPATLSGYDWFYQPTKAIVSNPKLSKEFTIGKDCSLIRISNDYAGLISLVTYYAEKLATLDGAVNMAIINSKFAYVLGAKNKAAARSIEMIFDKINKGEPTVVFDKAVTEGLGDEEPFEFLDRASLKNSYITSDLLSDWQTLLNQFDNEIGIPTLPAEKRERMITDEANARQADCNARISLWDECLKNSINETNKMFGTDIKYKFKTYDVNEEVTEESGKDGEKWELRSLPWQG